jgi:NAD+ diphosphatase
MSSILNAPPHVYTSVGFDRAAHRRRDSAWLAARRADRATLVVAMRGLDVLVSDREQGPYIFPLGVPQLGGSLPDDSVFLGLHEGRAVFSIALTDDLSGTDASFVDLRSIGPILSAAEAGLLAYARALAHWRVTHRYCGRCGHLTVAVEGGHMRRCPDCHTDVFPRTDPAVIVLVTRGDLCVLGRSPRFAPGMYSTLAGFVEVGESLETTLRREVMEEVGLRLLATTYRSSQPWPFPQSLMLGFRATTEDTDLVIDPEELEDAQWFHRDELRDPQHRPVQLPRADSIARFLIEEWLAEGA